MIGRAILCAIALMIPLRGMAGPLAVDLGQHLIAITTRFSGANILLFGSLEPSADIIAVISGPREDVEVRRREEVLGMWFNAERETLENVPAYYAVATSTSPLGILLPERVRRDHRIGISYALPASDSYADALIRLRKRAGLYRDQERAIQFIGERLFRLDIALPANVRTGIYGIDIYAVREGHILSHQSMPLLVNREGFDAWMYDFAQRHSIAYGILAIGGALLAGWVGFVVFRRP